MSSLGNSDTKEIDMEAEIKPFVLTWAGGTKGDTLATTEIKLHGAFESEDEAADWGHDWQKRNGDDPRWQVVLLDMQELERDSYGLFTRTPVHPVAS